MCCAYNVDWGGVFRILIWRCLCIYIVGDPVCFYFSLSLLLWAVGGGCYGEGGEHG